METTMEEEEVSWLMELSKPNGSEEIDGSVPLITQIEQLIDRHRHELDAPFLQEGFKEDYNKLASAALGLPVFNNRFLNQHTNNGDNITHDASNDDTNNNNNNSNNNNRLFSSENVLGNSILGATPSMLGHLTPLFTQFLAWQRLAQLSQEYENQLQRYKQQLLQEAKEKETVEDRKLPAEECGKTNGVNHQLKKAQTKQSPLDVQLDSKRRQKRKVPDPTFETLNKRVRTEEEDKKKIKKQPEKKKAPPKQKETLSSGKVQEKTSTVRSRALPIKELLEKSQLQQEQLHQLERELQGEDEDKDTRPSANADAKGVSSQQEEPRQSEQELQDEDEDENDDEEQRRWSNPSRKRPPSELQREQDQDRSGNKSTRTSRNRKSNAQSQDDDSSESGEDPTASGYSPNEDEAPQKRENGVESTVEKVEQEAKANTDETQTNHHDSSETSAPLLPYVVKPEVMGEKDLVIAAKLPEIPPQLQCGNGELVALVTNKSGTLLCAMRKNKLTIGRKRGKDIDLELASLATDKWLKTASRVHAEIVMHGNRQFFLRVLGRNGVRVDDTLFDDPPCEAPLVSGSTFTIARVKFMFYVVADQ